MAPVAEKPAHADTIAGSTGNIAWQVPDGSVPALEQLLTEKGYTLNEFGEACNQILTGLDMHYPQFAETVPDRQVRSAFCVAVAADNLIKGKAIPEERDLLNVFEDENSKQSTLQMLRVLLRGNPQGLASVEYFLKSIEK